MTLKLAAAALSAAALAAFALPVNAAPTKNDCFLASRWENWRSPSPDVLYLRVGMHDVYRVDLAAGSNRLNDVGAHLVSVMDGGSMVCGPLDLRLYVSDGTFRTPLIAKTITKMTPDEIAAIPKKYKP